MPRPPHTYRRAAAALVAAGALALTACGGLPGGVAASVNGEHVTDEFLGSLVAAERDRVVAAGAAPADVGELVANYQRDALTQVIVGILLEQEADERGIGLDEAEVEELWQEQVAIAGDEDALLARIAELGLTEDQARRQIAQGELVQRLQDDVRATIVVDEADLVALYEQRAAEWDVARASHIAVATEAEAREVIELLESGEATFEELAEERSLDQQSGAVGGGLGEAPRGSYPPAFDDAIWAADEGAVVGPVETDFGFHVIRVDERRTIPFEEVRPQIEEQVRGQRFQEEFGALVTALIAESDVRVAGRFGEWDGVAGEVRPVEIFSTDATS